MFTQEVPQSPFHVNVDPSHDASKVKAEGPGLAHTGRMLLCTHACTSVAELVPYLNDLCPCVSGIESGKPTHFTVLTKGAGKAAVDVSFSSPVKDFDIIDNYNYSQTVKYTPAKQVGQLLLDVRDARWRRVGMFRRVTSLSDIF